MWHWFSMPRQEGICRLKPVSIGIDNSFSVHSIIFCTPELAKPEQIIDISPTIESSQDKIFYFLIPLGQKEIVGVCQFVPSQKMTFWMDLNLNGKLSDEKPFKGTLKRCDYLDEDFFYFNTASIQSPDFQSAPFRFICDEEGDYLYVWPEKAYVGKIRINGKVYRVGITDGDYDGHLKTRFWSHSDFYYYKCDIFSIDINQDMYFSNWNTDNVAEQFPLGRYIKIRGHFYEISTSDDCRQLTLSAAQSEMGTLKIPPNMELSCLLYSDAAADIIQFSNQILLPAGRYKPLTANLKIIDPNQNEWQFIADFDTSNSLANFEIRANESLSVTFGPPFSIRTDVTHHGQDRVYINAFLVGQDREEYGLAIKQNGIRQEEPRIVIYDESGQILHSGSLEFG